MHIRQEQLDSLGVTRRQAFIVRTMDFLRAEVPDFANRGDAAQLRRFVEYAIERAGRYGFVTERHIVSFILLVVAWGTRFDEDPRHSQAKELLRDTRAPAGARIEFLLAMAAECQNPA